MAEFYAEAAFPLDRAWALRSFSTLLAQPSLGAAWVVTCDGRAAGHVVLTVRHSMEQGGLDAFIDDLFVRPAMRRRGLAALALETAIAECQRRGVLALHVEVAPDNLAATTLYARFGLRPRSDERLLLTRALARG